ncbi:hypothetical protein ACKI16_48165, partial [Streptomyces scabiei]|uniref:hypothetical protein n=1 Tax=Streptomyces scabiei TaxID=1930 RepID=UPI0038F6978C
KSSVAELCSRFNMAARLSVVMACVVVLCLLSWQGEWNSDERISMSSNHIRRRSLAEQCVLRLAS